MEESQEYNEWLDEMAAQQREEQGSAYYPDPYGQD